MGYELEIPGVVVLVRQLLTVLILEAFRKRGILVATCARTS